MTDRLLLLGGRVRTPASGATAAAPGVTALLVEDGRIGWLGTDDEATAAGLRATGAATQADLGGALVTPAFVDAHVHATSTGLLLDGLDLVGTTSLAQALARVERFARDRRGTGVLLGHGWDDTRWPERRPPTRTELDRATYGGVAYLTRIDVHSAVASSALLAAVPELAGMPGWTPDGLLTREAHHAARAAVLGSVTPAQRQGAQRATRRRCAELGIGMLHELGGPEISSADDLAGMLALAAAEPGPEVVGYWGELGGTARARELGARGAAGDLFADGAIGSHTAYLRTVYADLDDRGCGYLTAADVRDHVEACVEAGLQAGFHVIGDGALDTVLAGFTEAADRLGADRVRRGRHRLEHVEMVDPGHLATMARLGLVASVQPVFDALWGGPDGMYVERLGAERARPMNPFAAMAQAGVLVALGSDSPVTPLGPWAAVRAAVQHRTPGSGLAAEAAFEGHTRGGWLAAGLEGGRLEVGAPATLAVWDTDGTGAQGAGDPVAAVAAATGATDDADDPAAGLPRCLQTLVRGRPLLTSADLPAAGGAADPREGIPA